MRLYRDDDEPATLPARPAQQEPAGARVGGARGDQFSGAGERGGHDQSGDDPSASSVGETEIKIENDHAGARRIGIRMPDKRKRGGRSIGQKRDGKRLVNAGSATGAFGVGKELG